MELDFNTEERKFRDDMRAYIRDLMDEALTTELAEHMEGGGPEFRKAMKKMGDDGLLGLAWPKEYGGQERTTIEQFIFADEIQAVGFSAAVPHAQRHRPDDARVRQRGPEAGVLSARSWPARCSSRSGYSEPGAGTDLASLRTTAVRDGDEWVINGQKMWTSLAEYADYVWLAARTDPDPAKKHKGLSIFLVPTSAPGIRAADDPHGGRRVDQRDVLRRRPRTGRESHRRREQRLEA